MSMRFLIEYGNERYKMSMGGTLVINQGTMTRMQIVNEGTLIGIMGFVIGYGNERYRCQ